jgi:signal peptidase II
VADATAGRRTGLGPHVRLGSIIAVLIAVLDQLSKLWLIFVYELGSRGSVPVLPWVDFVLTWNPGISYGLFPQHTETGRWLLLAVQAGAIACLGIWMALTASRLTAVALALIVGGAIGNLIDRSAYGAVADFVFFHVDFGSWKFRWYVFNLADATVVAGVIGLVYESIFGRSAAKAP